LKPQEMNNGNNIGKVVVKAYNYNRYGNFIFAKLGNEQLVIRVQRWHFGRFGKHEVTL